MTTSTGTELRGLFLVPFSFTATSENNRTSRGNDTVPLFSNGHGHKHGQPPGGGKAEVHGDKATGSLHKMTAPWADGSHRKV